MMLLGIDTATERASVALYDGLEIHSEHSWRSRNNHTVELASYVNRMMIAADVNAKSLRGIAVAIGPGSFTGLRIGLGFAKGLSIAYSIPLVGISTLDILAYMQPKVDCVMLALITAGRKSIVSGRYIWHSGGWKTDGAPYITTWQDVVQETKSGSFYICGELGTVDRAEFAENVIIAPSPLNVRRAASMIAIASKRLDKGDFDEPNALSPFYLRST
ncbi:MAG: tRNA (adenosine(37)-N6)-threonylcarbamoyltransferase complex dimerization subunit type 1 TsaB [Chloroflexi bacterium]|nr:tRNA (adenosine(37)-N6)-threonylcarbamoyltransferase complex dimerization subunit type 1 TsaB [Chloroflexota bacterium]HCU79620.1 tRNA (adenosine(37)-N6)-threonylcarbamoyltransferase complex dimerization subunit type 1 TsaB [Chloroflexota bacterium]